MKTLLFILVMCALQAQGPKIKSVMVFEDAENIPYEELTQVREIRFEGDGRFLKPLRVDGPLDMPRLNALERSIIVDCKKRGFPEAEARVIAIKEGILTVKISLGIPSAQ